MPQIEPHDARQAYARISLKPPASRHASFLSQRSASHLVTARAIYATLQACQHLTRTFGVILSDAEIFSLIVSGRHRGYLHRAIISRIAL